MSNPQWSATADALAELSRVATKAQAENPLAPVTIIVPTHACGLDVTRYLGRNLNAGAGSTNIHAYTLKDLATELVATELHGRAPLQPSLRLGAISNALAENPGIFEPVADQPATARAIARTAVELDALPHQPTNTLPTLTQEVIRIHTAAANALQSRWYTNHEAFTVAAQKLQEPGTQKKLGTIIGFMLGTELQPGPLVLRESLENAGMQHITAAGSLDQETTVITASDADAETRAVVRLVVEQLDAGTPGHRIGVFHSVPQPYSALLTQRLTEAGITFVGPAPHTLRDSPMARGLLQLLALDTQDPDRRTILNILAEGILVWNEHNLPSSATCERLHANPPAEDESDDDANDDAPLTSHEARDRENYALFTSFLQALVAQLHRVHGATSWPEASDALTGLIADFMGPRSDKELPERTEARETLLQLSADLRSLDGIGPRPQPTLIRSTLEDGIAAKGGWTGKSGTGVVIGGYRDAVGRDLDTVYFMGAADGLAPARISEDPLLPDAIRPALNGNLPTIEQRATVAREQFFAALATGTQRTITSPRGDLRAAGNYQVSRWITADPRELESFAHGMEHGAPTSTALAPTEQEWRIRNLLTAANQSEEITKDPVLQRAVTLTQDRRKGVFSPFNGNLSAHAGNIMDPDRPLSPTRLEDWVTSPFSYFLKHVLKVRIYEDVELEVQINPMQRGNLVHKILEDYVREVASEGREPSPDRLLELAETAFTEHANPAWLTHVWDREQATIRQDLHTIFHADRGLAEDGWQYLAAEASFGPEETDSHPPVELTLEDGSTIRFRGKVDRIDQHDDGRIQVLDYKTGKADKYRKLKDHPTAEGSRFQLPVYGLFARTITTGPTSDVGAHYWFISARGKFSRIGYDVSDDVVEQLRKDAGLIITAIRNGVFPMKPEPTSFTSFTNFMGKPNVSQQWERLQDAEELAPYAELLKVEK